MRTVELMLAAALAGLSQAAAAEAPADADRPASGEMIHAVILDFASRSAPDYAKDMSDKLRIRLRRHEEYDVVDQLTSAELARPMPADADLAAVRKLVVETFACGQAVWGTLEKSGPKVTVEACFLDVRNPDKDVHWKKTFADDTERAAGEIARRIVEAIRGEKEWVPPQYGDEEEPKAFDAPPLNVNGTFDAGKLGWEEPDRVGTFLVKGPAGRGTILRVRTDLARDPWYEWRRKWRLGLANLNTPPNVPRDTSYSCVGGLEGVHYRSDYIKAIPGWRYWLVADVISLGGSMIFIKGFIDWTNPDDVDGLPERSLVERKLTAQSFANLPEARRREIIIADAKAHPERYRREVYRWYLNCGGSGDWKHVAAPFPPRGGLMDRVQWFRIEIYSFWPPGEYFYDNVFVYKMPGLTAPVPEEKPRTPNYKMRTDEREGFEGRYTEGATQPATAPAGR